MSNRDKYSHHCFPPIHLKDVSHTSSSHAPGDTKSTDTLEQQIHAAEASAFKEGFNQAKNQNIETEKHKLEPVKALMQIMQSALSDHMDQIQKNTENQAVTLAVDLARKILHHEIANRPELVGKIARQALLMVAGQDDIKIKAHPEDCGTIRSILNDMVQNADASDQIIVTPERSIEKGGCTIETDFGVIDARIDEQLSYIAAGLFAILAQNKKNSSIQKENIVSLAHKQQIIESMNPIKAYGHVTKVVGLVVEANGPVTQLGSICEIHNNENTSPVTAEVLGFRNNTVLLMPLEEIRTIGPGNRVVAHQAKASMAVSDQLLGRVIDGLGNPIDGLGPIHTQTSYPLYALPMNPLLRQRIRSPLDLGVRAVNGLLTIGAGQRIGIFAGSGVGKSVLMGMIARKSRADVNVIALIGERGRELNEFIEKELGEEGLKKSVVIVATSDHLPLVRVRGAFVATAIAEYFRDQGLHVNLMMDSITRFAMAQREIGLALGEPPTTKGYTPSVFTLLPKLLERAGTSDHEGTITGLYTVLVEGDDMNEPIADATRAILDGHIVLSRDLADQNHYPAIDVLKSISRVMEDIASLQHKHNAGRFKELLATYRKAEDLINIGAYVSGSNSSIDQAMAKIDRINAYLRQGIQENVNFEASLQQLDELINSNVV